MLGLLLLLPPAWGAALAGAEGELEPTPPWVFFPTPDEDSARVIDVLVENSFADLNKVVEARALLVRRFGVWSAPRLAQELNAANNEPAVLNAALTVIALRSRVGPAPELAPLVRPLIATARAPEPWRRLAAVLALGAFRGPEGLGRPRRRPDPLVALDALVEARSAFENEALPLLADALRDDNAPVRVAAALALGKTGGAVRRAQLLLSGLPRDAAVEPRMAVLLALGLLSVGGDFDQDRFVEGLADVETRIRAAAALGSALQVVCDAPPPWTDAPTRLLRALASAPVSSGKDDAAQALFARGCLAWKGQSGDLWEEVLSAATAADVSRAVAVAGAQALLACDDPSVRARALAQITGNARALQAPVLASLLLRAGSDGSLEGVKACRHWLTNPGLAPRADRTNDVRWHACIGLLRALAEGRLSDPQARALALGALEAAVDRGLERDAPLVAPLAELLRAQRPLLEASPDLRLPEEALRSVEAACPCPFGLLVRDLGTAAVARANAMIYEDLYGLADLRGLAPARDKDGREKDKDGSSKRFLQRHLAAWPYLTRLDLLAERGRRPAPALAFDDPAMVLDREPR